ncbi:MAG: glycosyltransferase family 39 protein [Candidatus Omnitrophica bacterium]|nr:glycosyltransferase family 39 protein [Candidatus Omnitrophota bacterium]
MKRIWAFLNSGKGIGCLFFVVVAGLYYKSFAFDLTYFDDQVWVLDYQWFFAKWSNALKFFTGADFISGCFYRPLLNLTFLIDSQVGHFHLWAYRLTNIIIHVSGVWLVYKFFEHFLKDKKPALILALVFAVHPTLTMAVAWLPGRTDSLLGVFILAAFLCFAYYIDNPKKRFWLGHVFFMLCAFLTKETALVLPVICLLYLWMVKKEWGVKKGWSFWLLWLIVLPAFLILRKSIMAQQITIVPLGTLISSFFENLPAVVLYLGKTLLPINLSVLPILRDVTHWYGVVVAAFLTILFIFTSEKDWLKISFGFVWFLLFLLPSLVMSFIEHEYRLYLPLLGILLVLAQTDLFRASMKNKYVWVWVLIIASLGLKTFYHQDNLKNRLIFWKSAVNVAPHSPLAHRNLAAMYCLVKDFDRAEPEFKEAARLNYKEPMVHNNLGLIYMNRGKNIEAEKEYLLEIKYNQTYGNVYYNYGLLKYMEKQYPEGAKLFEQAIFYDPKHMDAVKMLLQYYRYIKDEGQIKRIEDYLRSNGVSGF